MSPKLSVIVPVYNVENYLEDCIKSILTQSFQDFELILVNDGSTDNSLQICKQYQELDKRVKVFDKSNGGVSTARNRGIKEAIGEWVYFVDADDTICEGLFTILETKQSCDIIQFGYHTIQPNGTIITKYPHSNIVYNSADEFITKSKFNILSLWIHFIKSEVIKKNQITFSEGIKYAEDLEFVIKCYACASAIEKEPIIGYNYYIRESSAMSKAYTFNNAKIHLLVANNLIDFFTQNKLNKGPFFKSRIEYMIKSYFSFNLKVNNLNINNLSSEYFSFLKKNNVQNNFSLLLKLSIISPQLYFYLMKLKTKK